MDRGGGGGGEPGAPPAAHGSLGSMRILDPRSVQTMPPLKSHCPPPRKAPSAASQGGRWSPRGDVGFCVHCALLPSHYHNCEVMLWGQRWRHSCYSPRPKSYLLLTFNCPPNHFWEDAVSGITRSNATSSKLCPLCMRLILDIHQVYF